MFQECTEKFTVYGINLLSVQELVRDNSSKWIRHMSNSVRKNLNKSEEKSQVLFKVSSSPI